MRINFQCFVPRLQGVFQESRIITGSNHRSSRSGIFLAGDLAGQPLLKTSIADAIETMRAVARYLDKETFNGTYDHDLVVCGGGGAGVGAAIEAKRLGVDAVVLEKSKAGQTIRDFPVKKHIYANPPGFTLESPLEFSDCSKEDFIDHFENVTTAEGVRIIEGMELVGADSLDGGGFTIKTKSGKTLTCKAMILALGRRGNPRKLGVPGEDASTVHHNLLVPNGYEGRKILVVGGGNSAVEAAMALADNGAQVSITYRGESFYRPSEENKARIQTYINDKKLTPIFNAIPTAFASGSATLKTPDGEITNATDDAFVLIGADPPNALIEELGLKIENTWSPLRISGFVLSFVLCWLFYAFSKWGDGTTFKEFPFYMLGKSWEVLPTWVKPGIVKGAVYSLVVLGFGIPAMLRWRRMPRNQTRQTIRYLVIFFAQCFCLFIFPEFILKQVDPAHYWRIYGVFMPFPLVYETFFGASRIWLILCGLATFVALPIFVYWNGKRLCSWFCGCGCLAETLGDKYRHYALQGEGSRKVEDLILWPILLWAFVSAGVLMVTKNADVWYVSGYKFIIDFFLASVIGVAAYFFFGGRIWCRYFCPLAHYMRLLSAWYSKFRIKSSDKCIACGECSRHCQMGIDVMQFALKKDDINNRNSSCIGCEVCVSVCPMDNLTTTNKYPDGAPVETDAADHAE